jgi:hypothetical protein
MTFQKIAAAVIVGCALVSSVAPAMAQFFPFPPPPPRPYYEPGYDRPRYDPRFGGQEYYSPRRVPFGNVCETSRGACRTRPAPEGNPCRCNIPGFGPKRGSIVLEY